jgi:hypothetical protein
MPDQIDIGIAVSNCVSEGELCPEDQGLAGTYRVHVVGGLTSAAAVSAALDAFHRKVAIANLDDFIIWPFDPKTNRILDQDEAHEPGSKLNCVVSVEKIDSMILRGYRVTGYEAGAQGNSEGAEVGNIDFVASSRGDSLKRGRDLLLTHFGAERRLRSRISRLP